MFGAGSIGCYVGGRLAAAGAEVTLIGRERIGTEIRAHGLRLTDLHGADIRVGAADIAFATGPESAATADLVLVSVKSAATPEAGAALASAIGPDTVVVSAQNGLGNADTLRAALPEHVVLAAMVPFNVVHRGDGHFHQGSEGDLEIEQRSGGARIRGGVRRRRAAAARARGLPLGAVGEAAAQPEQRGQRPVRSAAPRGAVAAGVPARARRWPSGRRSLC